MVKFIIIGAAVLVVLLLFFAGYLKAPPDTAYIVSGLGRRRIFIGKAGWRVPFFERVDKLSLRVMQVDVKSGRRCCKRKDQLRSSTVGACSGGTTW